MTETAPAPPPSAVPLRPTEPLRRRILRALLYGNADRSMKARGRIGLAMLAFTCIYAIIAGRLGGYGLTPDSHGARRIGTEAAVRAASAPTPWPPRGPTCSIAAARFWRPTCACPRCSESRSG